MVHYLLGSGSIHGGWSGIALQWDNMYSVILQISILVAGIDTLFIISISLLGPWSESSRKGNGSLCAQGASKVVNPDKCHTLAGAVG